MKNKTRKSKKILMVAAIALMVALVAAMGTMTYSKYATKYDADPQSATAAKWGFVVTANVEKLFGTDYVKGAGDYAEVTTTGNGVAIKKKTSAGNIIAPGSTGSMSFEVAGQAEVAAKVVISCSLTSDITVDDYAPIKWTLIKGGTPVTGCIDVPLATINTYLTDEANAEYIAPGATLSSSYEISWEWDLETGADAAEKAANNVKDTAIGFKANEKAYNDVKNLYVGTSLFSTVVNETVYNTLISTTLAISASISVEQVQTVS